MKLCYDGALVMPNNYAVMNEEEMAYVEGGNASLPMKRTYLRKSTCTATASGLYYSKQVTGMSIQEIAEEIYAHAVLFYNAANTNVTAVNAAVVVYIMQHAGVIDIENGGDTAARKTAYSMIWNLN